MYKYKWKLDIIELDTIASLPKRYSCKTSIRHKLLAISIGLIA